MIAAMAGLVLENVGKRFDGIQALRGISLTVDDGDFVVLVGPSGCGKSTLLRLIAGLESLSSGNIVIGDRNVNDMAPKDRDIAMVFQNYSLYPHMTAYANMAFGLKMKKTPADEIDRRVKEAARILNIGNLLDKKSSALSGGQQQRVAVGRAIVRDPSLFLFDEPLSNLDARLRISMRSEIIRLHKKLGTTMVYVTHDQVEAMSMADKLVVIHNGEIQQLGKPLEIYNNPVNMFVAGFLGSPAMNFLECQVAKDGDAIFLKCGDLTLKPNRQKAGTLAQHRKIMLGIRPEDIYEKTYSPPTANLAPFETYIDFLEPLGNEVLATCRLNGKTITVRLNPQTKLRPEGSAELLFDMDKAHFFAGESEMNLNMQLTFIRREKNAH